VRKKYALYKRMSSSSSIAYRLANYAVPFDVNEIIHLLDLHAKEISSSFTSTPNPSSTSTSNSLPLSKSKLQKQLQVHASNDHMFSILAIQNQSGACVGIQNCFVSFSAVECRPVLEVLETYVLPSLRGTDLEVEEHLFEKSVEEAKQRKCCKIVMMEKIPREMPYVKLLEVSEEGDDGVLEDERKKCSACSTLTETLSQSTMMASWQICNSCVAKEQAASAYDVRYSGR
jgi:hypothetical protein